MEKTFRITYSHKRRKSLCLYCIFPFNDFLPGKKTQLIKIITLLNVTLSNISTHDHCVQRFVPCLLYPDLFATLHWLKNPGLKEIVVFFMLWCWYKWRIEIHQCIGLSVCRHLRRLALKKETKNKPKNKPNKKHQKKIQSLDLWGHRRSNCLNIWSKSSICKSNFSAEGVWQEVGNHFWCTT